MLNGFILIHSINRRIAAAFSSSLNKISISVSFDRSLTYMCRNRFYTNNIDLKMRERSKTEWMRLSKSTSAFTKCINVYKKKESVCAFLAVVAHASSVWRSLQFNAAYNDCFFFFESSVSFFLQFNRYATNQAQYLFHIVCKAQTYADTRNVWYKIQCNKVLNSHPMQAKVMLCAKSQIKISVCTE